jgi:hypothetical protein
VNEHKVQIDREMGTGLLQEISESPDLARLLSHRLFGATPSLFDGDRTSWVEWRYTLATGLAVDDHDVLVVGSAAFGISLHPDKEFRPFGDHSDVDIAVLSQRYFDTAWFDLRKLRDQAWRSMPQPVKNELQHYAPNYVFSGSIAMNRLIGRVSFGKDWLTALSAMAGLEPTTGRQIRVRLYRDAEALRWYQLRGLRIAKENLLVSEVP